MAAGIIQLRGQSQDRYSSASWNCPYQANVRNGPGKQYQVSYVANCSDVIQVRSGSETRNTLNGQTSTWVAVKSAAGQGWANQRLLSY
ncbi:hypothetical protein Cenrod_2687 [Candidatus Symbiobacter mobilis CR]|uniref:SH3b domain-containing protein n=1 Tax=Candidatus Symbiobacter mobilis CR TaxID=946483 RepID=U5NBD5_9BURK|nr:hypothetical protein Cenrod_2687 [Candidatus Symbiobacter mobilis CR]